MTPIAITLVLISAVGHATWNLLGKRSQPSPAFFLVVNLMAGVIALPVLAAFPDVIRAFPAPVWGLLALTGVFQAIYFAGLGSAYKHGDMSLAYPLARALPVLFIALVSIGLGAADQLTQAGLAGMGLVVVGCLVLPLASFRGFSLRSYTSLCGLLALVAAVGTTGYTLIDNSALQQLRTLPQLAEQPALVPLVFICLEGWFTTLPLALLVGLQSEERRLFRQLVIRKRSLAYAGVTGLVMMGTYGLVLAAMGYVRDISYVAAFRQVSIPLGAVLGMTIQHEPRYLPRLAGIGLISFGLVLVAIG